LNFDYQITSFVDWIYNELKNDRSFATLPKKGQDFGVVLITGDANVSDCLFGKSILFASEKKH